MMPSFFSTLRFRITLLHIAVFGITLLVFSTALYLIYQQNQASDFDRQLYNRALGIARGISIDVTGQLGINQTLIEESGRLFPFQVGNEYIQIRNPEGVSLAKSNNLGSGSLPIDLQLLKLLRETRFVYQNVPQPSNETAFWGKGNLRLLSMPLISQGRVQIILQLGVSSQAHDESLARLRTSIFLMGVPLTLLFAGLGGWWLAGRAFRPINQIISATQKLGAERLDERLPVPEAEDELRRLSVTLNEMLDRLEKAFKSQHRFIADASHELKTPLTILQGELDVLRQQPRSLNEYQAFVASASEELQRLTQIIQNLLLLARADSGQPLELKEYLRLDEVILEVIERLQSFAKKAQIKLIMTIQETSSEKSASSTPISDDALTIRGDTDLLASLFFNLIHNAIKYSAAGQTVEILLQRGADGLRLFVRDFGTGVRVEDVPHLFERFYRAENPTRRDVTGTGLGLAIAQWIAEAHQARITVESKPAEGSCFTVHFPKSTMRNPG